METPRRTTNNWHKDERRYLWFQFIITDKVISLESIKRKLKKKVLLECRCDERLKDKADGSTCLVYTGYLLVPFVYYESLK